MFANLKTVTKRSNDGASDKTCEFMTLSFGGDSES